MQRAHSFFSLSFLYGALLLLIGGDSPDFVLDSIGVGIGTDIGLGMGMGIGMAHAWSGYSFSGVMLNYSEVVRRDKDKDSEAPEWWLIAWDNHLQAMVKHPFAPDDPEKNPQQYYCLVPHEVKTDTYIDAFPLSTTLDKFGPRDKYNLTEYRLMRDQTSRDGIVHSETNLVSVTTNDFAGQNTGSIDAFGSTLVTWRLIDKRRQDKVMYSFADRKTNYTKPTQQDWIEFRNGTAAGKHWPLVGEDMRLYRSPSTGKLWANWCVLHEEKSRSKYVHFYYGELLAPPGADNDYKKITESLYVLWPPIHVSTRKDHKTSPKSEKNWPMFEYKGIMLFIERLNPLRVIAPDLKHIGEWHGHMNRLPIPNTAFAHTISLTVASNYCWLWGELRGGTSPQLIEGTGEYLGFFHSNTPMNSNVVRTYFLGAYTFSAHPPFAMTSMSKWPIVAPNWTKGFTYADIDFVPFPTTFMYDDQFFNVTLGWEEGEGRVLHLNRHQLYASLRPVTSVILGIMNTTSTDGRDIDDWSNRVPWESFIHTVEYKKWKDVV